MRQIVLRLFIVNCENYWEQVCPSGFRPLSNKNNFFHTGAPFLYLLNTSESICFADVFREYENRTLVWNKLNPFTLHFHRMPLKCFLNSSQKNENEDSCLGVTVIFLVSKTIVPTFSIPSIKNLVKLEIPSFTNFDKSLSK